MYIQTSALTVELLYLKFKVYLPFQTISSGRTGAWIIPQRRYQCRFHFTDKETEIQLTQLVGLH